LVALSTTLTPAVFQEQVKTELSHLSPYERKEVQALIQSLKPDLRLQ